MIESKQKPEELMRLVVRATREIAYESSDHLNPWGTRRDNSRQRRFNRKLYRLFSEYRRSFWILDLGCSGGGFVKDCLDDGCVAVGIEGSDFSKKMRRAEWRTIPEFLFTADITAPFTVEGEFTTGTTQVEFDAITSWEVLEHIHENDLPALVENVKRHMRPGGLWVMSISPVDDIINGINLHQTVKPKAWWIQKFKSLGLVHLEKYVTYFNTQFVRGPKYSAHPRSFHLVLTNKPEQSPVVPAEGLMTRVYDTWLGSLPHRLLFYAVNGTQTVNSPGDI